MQNFLQTGGKNAFATSVADTFDFGEKLILVVVNILLSFQKGAVADPAR